MSQKATISEDLLTRFENGQPGGDVDGQMSGKDAEAIKQSIDNLTDTIQIAIDGFDSYCKEKGLPGTGTVENDRFAKLTTIVARRNLPTNWLEKSPEYLLLATVAGIAGQNYIALQRMSKQENEGDKENE